MESIPSNQKHPKPSMRIVTARIMLNSFIKHFFTRNFFSNILLLGSDQCLGLDYKKKNEEKRLYFWFKV
jgi:hypothetical protein